MQKKYYTTRDAAKLTGLDPTSIRREIRTGKLQAESFNGAYIITPEDMADYLERRKAGRNGKV